MRRDRKGAWPSRVWNPVLHRMLDWTGRRKHVQYVRTFRKLLEWSEKGESKLCVQNMSKSSSFCRN